ncbi:MAG: FprA family A-type flavoprotein [candidate division WOR-3 bacterium]|nr:FprA family A-type flavoprotein [candidate division WOR-3 bacterium]MDW7987972.1 FprA family A-type flavoprotein [candidate division WOR-3 bacterium]
MIFEIAPGIFYVGALDFERRLFDELIPLPYGTSYNAFLIKGSEKIALIDTVDPSKENVLIDNLKKLKINRLDYIIAHHAEQDHSGVIPVVLKHFTEAKVVTNVKCKELLQKLLLIPEERFLVIQDKDTLSLGNKTLEFIFAPWVHWPETILTYLREDQILFTCDFLGSHFASSELFVTDECRYYDSAKRYYAEIMMPFRTNIRQHLETISNYQIKLIAPSHGPLHNKPEFILNAYRDWTSDQVKNEVVIPYVSMHGSVKAMIDYFSDQLISLGINVKPFNLTVTDIGELAMALVDAATLVIGTSAVLTGPHPQTIYIAYLVNALRPKTKFVSLIASYAWGAKVKEKIVELIPNVKAELLDGVIIQGYPTKDDFTKLENLAEKIKEKHKNLGII